MPRFVIAPDGQAFNPEFVANVGVLSYLRPYENPIAIYTFTVRCERYSVDVTVKGTKEECNILRDKFIQSLNSTQ